MAMEQGKREHLTRGGLSASAGRWERSKALRQNKTHPGNDERILGGRRFGGTGIGTGPEVLM